MNRARLSEFMRFCMVGVIGFIIDAGMLELLVRSGVATPLARIVSIALALQVTYLLHWRFTFRVDTIHSPSWLTFMLANLAGACANYAVFLIVLNTVPLVDGIMARQVALVAGTCVGLAFNYWSNRRFVFMPKK